MGLNQLTNASLKDIAQKILESDNFVLCGHISPDGDCVGSQLGLYWALKALGKEAYALLARNEPLSLQLSSIPGSNELIWADTWLREYLNATEGKPFICVVLDLSDYERLGDERSVFDASSYTINVDHHRPQKRLCDLSHIDSDAAATALLVWELVQLLAEANSAAFEPVWPKIAQACYSGLLTDTGGFQFQNTSKACFVAAAQMLEKGADAALAAKNMFQNKSLANLKLTERFIEHAQIDVQHGLALSYLTHQDLCDCNAVKSDTEGLIDLLRSLSVVKVCAFLRENDEMGQTIKGSLRAKDATDVSVVARAFNGGGHKAAAGMSYEGSIDECMDKLKVALLDQMRKTCN